MAGLRKTAVVVDDEPDIVKIVQTMLEGEGFEVWSANDGLEALKLLKERIPDILILDRMMPGMNGTEVISKLKESPQTSRIPIIMLTSMGKLDDVSEGYQKGADGYVTKPFTRARIINAVNVVLTARPAPSAAVLQSQAVNFLRACARLSKRTAELAARFAGQEGLSPNAWAYQGLETRLRTDQEQEETLRAAPEWRCCFRGWGVDFQNTETGEEADLAIGPGGRCDSFDEWRVQCYVENEAGRASDFVDLHAMIDKHGDAARLLMEQLAREQWIEPARPAGAVAKEELDAQLGDRWVVSPKGSKTLQQSRRP